VIPPAVASFLQEGLSIHVATRDARLVPLGARALALVVRDEGRAVTVYLADSAARRLRAALDVSRQAAVNVGRPSDDRACQVKGVLEAIRPAEDGERDVVRAQWEGFLEQLAFVGISRCVAAAWPTWPAVAIELRVTAVFEQTPGPQAGSALAGATA